MSTPVQASSDASQPAPGVERAALVVPRKQIRERVVLELQKHGVGSILCTEEPQKILTETKLYKHSMLVIDLSIGFELAISILEASKSHYKADTRPIYLLGKDLNQNVLGLASDYNAIRVRAGTINGSEIKKDIQDICDHERLTFNYRQSLHEVALLREQNLHDKAEQILRTLCESQDANHKINLEYAETLIEMGQLDRAIDILESILKTQPKQIRALGLRARIEMKKGHYENAQGILEAAQIFNPKNVQRLIDLGHCLLSQDKIDKAKEHFDEALAINMDSIDASQGRGQCALMEGDISEAMDFLHHSSDLEIVAAFNNAAVICIRKGKISAGMELYQTAMTRANIAPGVLSRIAFNLGLGYLKSKQLRSAKLAFKKAVMLDPDFTKAHHNINVLSKRSSSKACPAVDTEVREELTVMDWGEEETETSTQNFDLMSAANLDLNLSDDLFENINIGDI